MIEQDHYSEFILKQRKTHYTDDCDYCHRRMGRHYCPATEKLYCCNCHDLFHDEYGNHKSPDVVMKWSVGGVELPVLSE